MLRCSIWANILQPWLSLPLALLCSLSPVTQIGLRHECLWLRLVISIIVIVRCVAIYSRRHIVSVNSKTKINATTAPLVCVFNCYNIFVILYTFPPMLQSFCCQSQPTEFHSSSFIFYLGNLKRREICFQWYFISHYQDKSIIYQECPHVSVLLASFKICLYKLSREEKLAIFLCWQLVCCLKWSFQGAATIIVQTLFKYCSRCLDWQKQKAPSLLAMNKREAIITS